MGTFTRNDVATPYGKCVSCTVPTRSHVLRRAGYSEYAAEQVIEESDVYAVKQWEEVEEITKVALTEAAIVMCHRCWIEREEKFSKFIEKNFAGWRDDPINNGANIKASVQSMNYYKFKDRLTQEAIEILIKSLKVAIK
jgi:hypothetical protein